MNRNARYISVEIIVLMLVARADEFVIDCRLRLTNCLPEAQRTQSHLNYLRTTTSTTAWGVARAASRAMRTRELTIALVGKRGKKFLDLIAFTGRARYLFITEYQDFKILITLCAMIFIYRHVRSSLRRFYTPKIRPGATLVEIF